MKLSQIIKDSRYSISTNIDNWDIDIESITFDSRAVKKHMLFVAQVGTHVDGHKYIDTAIENGATAIVCQQLPANTQDGIVYVVTDDSDQMLGEMASNYYGRPSEKLKLVGITGTNGKTTTVTLLHQLFRQAGYHTGLLSTIVNKINDTEISSTHTTPDALELNALLNKMVEAGCEYCFMEVSSHSVVQKRIARLRFAGGIFSNITHDHLDFHKTMAGYIAAKKAFFDQLPHEAFALTNIDDRNGLVMTQNTPAAIKTYSLRQMADFRCKIVENGFQGLLLELDGKEVWSQLVGQFNAYNLTAIYAAAVLSGIEKDEAMKLLSGLKPAEGRFAHIYGKSINAIIDYAHTPDALENVIDTINNIRKDSQTLITVVGCGGDRDKTKRPEMAKIAVGKSGKVILTSDNPRTENPETILDDMEAGLSAQEKSEVVRITDRRQALRAATMMAKENDIILVAGKGHEKYQEINGVKHHFDDMEEIKNLLK